MLMHSPENAHLTVVTLAERRVALAGDTNRFVALLGKANLFQHPDAIGAVQIWFDEDLEGIKDVTMIPRRLAEEALECAWFAPTTAASRSALHRTVGPVSSARRYWAPRRCQSRRRNSWATCTSMAANASVLSVYIGRANNCA